MKNFEALPSSNVCKTVSILFRTQSMYTSTLNHFQINFKSLLGSCVNILMHFEKAVSVNHIKDVVWPNHVRIVVIASAIIVLACLRLGGGGVRNLPVWYFSNVIQQS